MKFFWPVWVKENIKKKINNPTALVSNATLSFDQRILI